VSGAPGQFRDDEVHIPSLHVSSPPQPRACVAAASNTRTGRGVQTRKHRAQNETLISTITQSRAERGEKAEWELSHHRLQARWLQVVAEGPGHGDKDWGVTPEWVA
jgi:hypothetical protein